jgi:predicted MPP superfamily phosphohydrolase
VLHNEAVPLRTPAPQAGHEMPGEEGPLYLVGIGPYTADADDPDAALAGVPSESPRLVLMHDPLTFRKLAPGAAPLAMAGHTHGGQVRIPFKPRWIPLKLVDTSRIYEDGWLEEESAGGNRLYVNRGLGFSGIPVRIGCPPEVTVFMLLPPPSSTS